MNRSRFLVLCLFVSAALTSVDVGPLPAAPAGAKAAGKGGVPGYVVIPLGRGHGNRLRLAATVEGTKGLMILDTGASFTLLSDSKYGGLRIGGERKLPAGAPPARSVNGTNVPTTITKDFWLGKADLGPAFVALAPRRYLFDQAALYDAGSGTEHDGLLGEDLLRRCHAIVDCARLILYVNVDSAKVMHLGPELIKSGWTRIPMTRVGGDYAVPCKINGHDFRLIVDTGAGLTTVDRDLVRGTGVGATDIPMRGGLVGTQAADLAVIRLASMTIGSYALSNVQMMGNSDIRTFLSQEGAPGEGRLLGFLGGDILGKNGAIIDIGGEALYLKHGATK